MASKPCNPATCRHCRPGRPCAETARWLADEDYYEKVDASHTAFLAASFTRTPNRPEGSYVDSDMRYPHDSRGHLLEDPAVDWR